jgi:hypothetical protein
VPRHSPSVEAPLTCTIRAAGTLDASWSDRLGGLRVREVGGDYPVVELSGRLLDQAALHGVLRTIYALRLPLITVECREAQGATGGGAWRRDAGL